MAEFVIFAPHPDDAELGMGAAIAKFVAEGRDVALIDLSDGEPTPHGSKQLRTAETRRASEILGVTAREQLDLVNRRIEHTLEARWKVAGVIRRHRPRWVFAPFNPDAHPDHVAATRIIEDACFDAKLSKADLPGRPHQPRRIIYYYCTHLRLHAEPSFVLDVSEHYAKKTAALAAYQSQFYLGRGDQAGQVPEMIRTRDRYFGDRIGVEYGEPFCIRELVGLAGVAELL